MARYAKRARSSRRSSARAPAYRSRRRAPARRATARRSSGGGRTQVVKLVIQTTASPVSPEGLPLGLKPAPAPKTAKF